MARGHGSRWRAPGQVVRGVCLGLLLAPSLAARSAPEAGVGGEPRAVIMLDGELEATLRELLVQSLRELLARIDLTLADTSVSADTDVVARVSIELLADAAIVTVSSARDGAAPGRYRVERTSGELFRETLAHVILAAVEARTTLRQDPVGSARDPALERQSPLEQEPARDAARSVAGRPSWSVGAHGGPLRLAPGRAGVALGASLAVAFRLPERPSAALEASYLIPVLVREGDVAAQLSRVGLRARARAEPLASGRVALQLGLGCGLELISLTPRSVPPERSVSRSTRLQPTLGGSVGGRLRLSDGFDIVASVGADLELAPRRWTIEGEGPSQRFYETPRWLAYAALGFEWGLGPAREALPP